MSAKIMGRAAGLTSGLAAYGSARYGDCCLHGCPCGYYGDNLRACTCSETAVTRYQKRLSGPLLDRVDIHLEVPRVEYEKLASDRAGEASSTVRQRVEAAREHQRARFADSALTCNADMGQIGRASCRQAGR